jgi:hypothetical protein
VARLRRLAPDSALFRRRAAGEPLRELGRDYGVAHTTLGRYFARPEAVRELKRATRLNRAEQRAAEARRRTQEQAERAARRRAKQQPTAASAAASRRRDELGDDLDPATPEQAGTVAAAGPSPPPPADAGPAAATSERGRAATRLRRQAAREKRKLLERERDAGVAPLIEPGRSSGGRSRRRTSVPNPHHPWLARRKNLSAHARSEASGLVRVRRPDDSIRKWVERAEVEALLEAGWLLDDSSAPDSTRRSN